MKLSFLCCLILLITGVSCNNNRTNDASFTSYDTYFVKNDVAIDSSGNFLEIHDMASFNQVFGAAATMNQTKWLQAEDFNTHFIIAIIKDFGNNRYNLKINKIIVENKIIKVDYNYTLQEQNVSYSSTGNVIASLNNVPHEGVEFYENGKLMKKI